ncbi:MAG: exopolyphosphatase, partial [Bacteroidota bacterium]|nr:exopolyphosphatase [Bacteroidota bacterium]
DRLAVIDLGSNTFHLLIVEVTDGGEWKEIHKEREYVKLASGGIKLIDANAEQRAVDAMIRFRNLMTSHDVKQLRAIGTAALREAENGIELADKLEEITGIHIDIIQGQEEARFILLGIKSALPHLDNYGLIMDIGGGSVEFILYSDTEELYKESFKVGVAILYETFHHSDPISKAEIMKVNDHLKVKLRPLIEKLKKIESYYLIGASGSFEVLLEALSKKQTGTHWAELDLQDIVGSMDAVITASLDERRQMPGIPDERLDYIVVAYLLIRFLLNEAFPERLYFCDYALKEGVLAEMIQNNNLD